MNLIRRHTVRQKRRTSGFVNFASAQAYTSACLVWHFHATLGQNPLQTQWTSICALTEFSSTRLKICRPKSTKRMRTSRISLRRRLELCPLSAFRGGQRSVGNVEEQASLARAEHPCVAGDSLPPNAIVVVRYLLCSLVPEHKCWLRVCCMVTVRSLYICGHGH